MTARTPEDPPASDRTYRSSGDRARQLQRLAGELSGALSPAEVGEVIVTHGIEGTGAIAGGIAVRSEDGTELRVIHSTGFSEDTLAAYRRYPLETPIPTRDAVKTGEPVFLGSVAEWEERYPGPPGASGPGGDAAYAALPLEARGRILGALTMMFPTPRRFADGEREFLSTLAHHCAQALDRAHLFEEAVAANRAKSDFLAVMSHELRTPLSAAMGYVALLREGIVGELNENQRELLDRVESSNRQLLLLIEDLLRFTKIEAEKEEVRISRVTAAELLEGALTTVRPLVQEQDVVLSSEIPSDSPTLDTDAPKATRVLLNLLVNAVKFTDEGEIRAIVTADDGRVTFEVRDSGLGIDPDDLDRLFDPFWQADQSATRRTGGAGLGLSVAHRLAELLGGGLSAESELGRGSTFFFWLPR